jgi:putative oxidoreductase
LSTSNWAWAAFVARTILGFLILFSGAHKAFQLGILEYGRQVATMTHSAALLPDWAFATLAMTIALMQLVLGVLIIIGLWTRPSLLVLGGAVLITAAAYGVAGLIEQRWGPTGMSVAILNNYIFPRAGLLIALLLMPEAADTYSIDGLLRLKTLVSKHAATAWAIFVARALLGLVFLVAGVHKVFIMGPLVHAKTLFVDPYAGTALPLWGLWASGTVVPFLELAAGALTLIGLCTRPSLIILGSILVFVTFGHLVTAPMFVANSFILTRTALLMVVLVLPSEADSLAMDRVLNNG